MAIPRPRLVELTVTAFYHCVSRRLRKAIPCGGENQRRKDWIEKRLQELFGILANERGGYAIMVNHLHAPLRIDVRRVEDYEILLRDLSVLTLGAPRIGLRRAFRSAGRRPASIGADGICR